MTTAFGGGECVIVPPFPPVKKVVKVVNVRVRVGVVMKVVGSINVSVVVTTVVIVTGDDSKPAAVDPPKYDSAFVLMFGKPFDWTPHITWPNPSVIGSAVMIFT